MILTRNNYNFITLNNNIILQYKSETFQLKIIKEL